LARHLKLITSKGIVKLLAPRAIGVTGLFNPAFRPRRHKLSALAYRQSRLDAQSIWDDIACELKAG
jgi:putative transposase